MAARPRARNRRDWPTGLSESRPGYYVWFNPLTKNYVRIGRVPLAEARIQAMDANIWASGQAGKVRLVDRIQQQDKTVREWLEEWVSGVESKSDNTIRNYRVRNKAIVAEIGDHALGRLSVQDVAKALDSIRVTRGGPTAKGCRAVMVQAFNKAVAKGLMASKPVLNREVARLFSIPGSVPNPINMPDYCFFRDRCDERCDRCAGAYPGEISLTATHKVSCWLHEGMTGGDAK